MYSRKLEQAIRDHNLFDSIVPIEHLKTAVDQCGLEICNNAPTWFNAQSEDIVLVTWGDTRADYRFINLGPDVCLTWSDVVQGHLLVFVPHLRFHVSGQSGVAPDLDMNRLIKQLDLYPLFYKLEEDVVALLPAPWGQKQQPYICFKSEAQKMVSVYVRELASLSGLKVEVK